MRRVVVILIVGLTRRQLGADTPNLSALAEQGFVAPIEPVLPAVTCTVQSTYLTGVLPSEHGVVANGWYYRERAEVNLWRQSNRLVLARKVWEVAKERDPAFTCAKLFWWFNMFADVDWSVTPRPAYLHDGRKEPDGTGGRRVMRRRLAALGFVLQRRPRALQKCLIPFVLFEGHPTCITLVQMRLERLGLA